MTDFSLSNVIALVAVIVGPSIQLVIARRQNSTHLKVAETQFRAVVLSKNRQDWINELRAVLANFATLIATWTSRWEVIPEPKDYAQKEEQARLLVAKAELLINPKEEDHVKLMAVLRQCLRFAIERETRDCSKEELEDSIGQLVVLTQKILKREWERVKAGR